VLRRILLHFHVQLPSPGLHPVQSHERQEYKQQQDYRPGTTGGRIVVPDH